METIWNWQWLWMGNETGIGIEKHKIQLVNGLPLGVDGCDTDYVVETRTCGVRN